MPGESWELPSVTRPAEIHPPPSAIAQVPGQDLPAPTLEQAETADVVFSSDPEANPAAAALGIWSAGMLLNDFIEDAKKALAEDEEQKKKDEIQPKKPIAEA
jgi:hypothetical protein